jgi:nucleotide-binding universal stress UspA family protein
MGTLLASESRGGISPGPCLWHDNDTASARIALTQVNAAASRAAHLSHYCTCWGLCAMPLKDLVVYVDAKPASEHRVALAARLAARHGAHLAGVHSMWVREIPAATRDAPYHRVDRLLDAAAKERAATAERLFRAALARELATAEWRCSRVDSVRDGVVHARHADLAIVGQIDPDDHSLLVPQLSPEDLLLGGGRPVLVVPYAGRFAGVGERVLIAWNAGREAARAVNDALPFLTRAAAATVLTVNPRAGATRHGEVAGADIAVHLARHGVTVAVEQADAAGRAVADVVLDRAADWGADLIVMGGYGRARLREIVIGGTTQDMLARMRVPVLMSH